jgi:hypothetical protein
MAERSLPGIALGIAQSDKAVSDGISDILWRNTSGERRSGS